MIANFKIYKLKINTKANLQVNVLRTLDTCISYSFGISKPVDINFSY